MKSKKYNKKDFKEKYQPKKDEIDEFFDLNDDNINFKYNTEIQSGPVPKSGGDDSEYVKGLPTITDKLALQANPRNWWQLYLRGYPLIRTYGIHETELKDIIKELLDKKDDNEGILPADEREQKVNKIKKQIKTNKFSDEDLKELERLIKIKLGE